MLSLFFVLFPGPSNSGDRMLGDHGRHQMEAVTCRLPRPSHSGFLGVQLECLLRCAVCLFWGADLWLQPSQWMLTIQNPKKSWLAMKPACSLVADATLGPRLPSSSSGCPASLSLAGDGLVRSWLALLSPLFCEWAWRYLRLGLFAFSWDS